MCLLRGLKLVWIFEPHCKISVIQRAALFLEMAKCIDYFKQRYLGFKLQLMLGMHVQQVYSTYYSLLTVTKRRASSDGLWRAVTTHFAGVWKKLWHKHSPSESGHCLATRQFLVHFALKMYLVSTVW